MKAKKVTSEFDPPDFPQSRLGREPKRVWRAADRFGYVGILTNGKRRAYLVSQKIWRVGVLDSESIVKITGHGKIRGYVVNAQLWEVFLSFIGSVTPGGRRRLPKIAACAARRDAEIARTLDRRGGSLVLSDGTATIHHHLKIAKQQLDREIARKLA